MNEQKETTTQLSQNMYSDNNQEHNKIYIDGKGQVIELLKWMNFQDKSRLIKNIRQKNPILANELARTCISFEDIMNLNEQSLRIIITKVTPAVLGLALSLASKNYQKKVLSLIPRELALTAFEIMQKDLSGNRNECLRAQNKILQLALSLYDNKLIDLLDGNKK